MPIAAILKPVAASAEIPAITLDRPAVMAKQPRMRAVQPMRVSSTVAFRECLRIVVEGLKDQGEQWDADSKQGATSTLFISMAKAGFIDFMPEVPSEVR
jgi:hypothetical protein